jgi:phospholipid/cholesterol/gamma-HCH transport system ATP-binding protein
MSDHDQPAIVLESVSKSFGSQKVLEDVSFTVNRGEAFCILGRSGMGKSVTLKLIISLLKPDSGKILVEGADVASLANGQLLEVRKKVGFLFQDAALFDSINLAANLAFVLKRHTNGSRQDIEKIVQEKLAAVGLEKDADKMPPELSGGMRKRAGLARALVLDPEILLVDEPSSGLDRVTASEIDHLLLDLKENKKTTMVIVTHDPEGARIFADRLGVLDQGKMIAAGTSEEFAKNENQLVRQLVSGSEAK